MKYFWGVEIDYTLDDIEMVAKRMIARFDYRVIRIDGAMGAGKTTLIKSICKAFGVREAVNSPTFSLVNTYQGETQPICHFDFYRIAKAAEALDFGVEEYFESEALCLLEWAEKVAPHLPENYHHFTLKKISEHRRVLKQIH